MTNQIGKLYNVNADLGLNLRGGQQTTRILFDTEPTGSTTNSVEFFQNFAGKTSLETNLKENKLPSGESMVVKEIAFKGGDIRAQAVLDFYVGNLRVIKDLPLTHNLHDSFSYSPLGGQTTNASYIRLITDIVIPPQVTFRMIVKNQVGAYVDASVLVAYIKGVGVLFNPSTSL